jgi:site-specific DNA recombinase
MKMESTNDHCTKKAILYARVSTDEQARMGYSLAQQLEALREYAGREKYEILEEVTDPGQSGASLERPGMDRVRDLVAARGVSVVLAQDRDRFAREPAYHYLLKREFEEHGCKLRALNDRGDDSPEGELADGIFDQFGKYERAKFAERSRRGKLRKAREGKIVANHSGNYGFKYNAARDGYEIDEKTMPIVRRIFRMIGFEGCSLRKVKQTFEAEGLPTPAGNKYWSKTFIREVIKDDVYRPHSFEEIKALIAPEVAARLDPNKSYGIWWFNRQRHTFKQVAENTPEGRIYRKKKKAMDKPRNEWIAVPVPNAGVSRELVDAARASIKDNPRPSSAGRRFWELSGGILRCGECGYAMTTNNIPSHSGKLFFYYRCAKRLGEGKGVCSQRKNYRADKIEPQVWELVSGIMRDPEQLRDDLERMIDQERKGLHGDPYREAKVWAEKLVEVDRLRSGYQDLAAKGLMTFEELEEKLRGLEETRKTAERELEALRSRRERIEELERDKEALLESYAGMAPEALGSLLPEERHQVYKMLRLKVIALVDYTLEVNGAFVGELSVSNTETGSPFPASLTRHRRTSGTLRHRLGSRSS